jgi:hypothetical protein
MYQHFEWYLCYSVTLATVQLCSNNVFFFRKYIEPEHFMVMYMYVTVSVFSPASVVDKLDFPWLKSQQIEVMKCYKPSFWKPKFNIENAFADNFAPNQWCLFWRKHTQKGAFLLLDEMKGCKFLLSICVVQVYLYYLLWYRMNLRSMSKN